MSVSESCIVLIICPILTPFKLFSQGEESVFQDPGGWGAGAGGFVQRPWSSGAWKEVQLHITPPLWSFWGRYIFIDVMFGLWMRNSMAFQGYLLGHKIKRIFESLKRNWKGKRSVTSQIPQNFTNTHGSAASNIPMWKIEILKLL